MNERLGIFEGQLDLNFLNSWPTSGSILKDLFKIKGEHNSDQTFGAVSQFY